jgi:hypothetical protein
MNPAHGSDGNVSTPSGRRVQVPHAAAGHRRLPPRFKATSRTHAESDLRLPRLVRRPPARRRSPRRGRRSSSTHGGCRSADSGPPPSRAAVRRRRLLPSRGHRWPTRTLPGRPRPPPSCRPTGPTLGLTHLIYRCAPRIDRTASRRPRRSSPAATRSPAAPGPSPMATSRSRTPGRQAARCQAGSAARRRSRAGVAHTSTHSPRYYHWRTSQSHLHGSAVGRERLYPLLPCVGCHTTDGVAVRTAFAVVD